MAGLEGFLIAGLCVWVAALLRFRRQKALDAMRESRDMYQEESHHWKCHFDNAWAEVTDGRRKIVALESRIRYANDLSTEIQSRTKLAA